MVMSKNKNLRPSQVKFPPVDKPGAELKKSGVFIKDLFDSVEHVELNNNAYLLFNFIQLYPQLTCQVFESRQIIITLNNLLKAGTSVEKIILCFIDYFCFA